MFRRFLSLALSGIVVLAYATAIVVDVDGDMDVGAEAADGAGWSLIDQHLGAGQATRLDGAAGRARDLRLPATRGSFALLSPGAGGGCPWAPELASSLRACVFETDRAPARWIGGSGRTSRGPPEHTSLQSQ